MHHILTIAFLFCFLLGHAQDNTLTFTVRKIEYKYLGDETVNGERPPPGEGLSLAQLFRYIPAKQENRYRVGQDSDIISCRVTMVDPAGKTTAIIVRQTPALVLLEEFIDLQPGTTIEIDEIKIIDSVKMKHDLPGIKFTTVDIQGIKRVERLYKKLLG